MIGLEANYTSRLQTREHMTQKQNNDNQVQKKIIVTEDTAHWVINGFWVLVERNPIAPGWILQEWDVLWGLRTYTPISWNWHEIVEEWVKLLIEAKGCFEETPEEHAALIAKLKQIIHDGEKFYKNFKVPNSEVKECRSLLREKAKPKHFTLAYGAMSEYC